MKTYFGEFDGLYLDFVDAEKISRVVNEKITYALVILLRIWRTRLMKEPKIKSWKCWDQSSFSG